jgi:hypothetical protein
MIEFILGLSIAQWIGFLAAFICIVATTQTDDKWLLLLASLGIGIWAIHYGMLGAYTGMMMNIFVSIRCLLSLKWQGLKIGIPFSILFIVLGFIVYQSPASFLPISASIIGTLGTTLYTGIKMRLSLVLCSLLWLCYAIIYGSFGGIILEIINICLYSITIYKIYYNSKTYYI